MPTLTLIKARRSRNQTAGGHARIQRGEMRNRQPRVRRLAFAAPSGRRLRAGPLAHPGDACSEFLFDRRFDAFMHGFDVADRSVELLHRLLERRLAGDLAPDKRIGALDVLEQLGFESFIDLLGQGLFRLPWSRSFAGASAGLPPDPNFASAMIMAAYHQVIARFAVPVGKCRHRP